MFKIVKKRQLNSSVVLLEIEAPFVAKKAQPGQFIIFRTDEHGERVPLTIADFDREKGTVTIIVQTVGRATKLLGSMNEGDSIRDFVGPVSYTHLEQNPAQISTVRRFFTYYLDTAIKFIDQYLYFKKTSKDVRSVSLQETTAKIVSSLDLIIESFQTQIDKLVQNDVMNIEADISVLETMIESEKY